MFPASAMNYMSNNAATEALDGHDVFYGHSLIVHFSQFKNVLILQSRILFASYVSAFALCVSHVVSMCAKKNVIRIYACTSIAVMARLKSFRNFNSGKDDRKSVRASNYAVVPEIAVPVLAFATHPQPARSKFRTLRRYWAILVDFGKEQLPLSLMIHGNRNKTASTELEVKPACHSGNESGRRESGLFVTFFAAALRPVNRLRYC